MILYIFTLYSRRSASGGAAPPRPSAAAFCPPLPDALQLKDILMKTILLTDGEFTGMIKTLRSLSEPVRIVGFVSSEHAAHVTMLDSFYVAPSWRSETYLPYLLDVVRKENVDLIFPVVTTSLEFMAARAEEIREKTGAILVSSPQPAIRAANNKALLFETLAKAGTIRLAPSADNACPEVDLSRIITEFRTAGTAGGLREACGFFTSRGIGCISKPVCGENAEGFMRFVPEKEYALCRLRGEAAHLASLETFDCMEDEEPLPEERLVMPYLPGDEWDVDVLVKDGEILASTVRKNLEMFGGLSACTVTVEDPRLLNYCRGIVKCLGLRYLSCISFRADENGDPKLLEINPRAMGSIHLSTMAGNSLVEQLLAFEEFRRPEAAVCRTGTGGDCPENGAPVSSIVLPDGGGTRVTRPGFMSSLYNDLAVIPAVHWNEISPPVRETYEHYYHKINSRITDIVFNCRFAWDRLYHFRWSVIEDCFVQASSGSEYAPPFMLMPLGEFDTAKLDRIVDIVREDFRRRGLNLTIYGIGEEYLPLFEAMKTPHRPVYFNDDFSDYLYSAEDLRTLAGRKYSKKRNHLAHFFRAYPDYVYESLKPEHFEECLALVRRWEAEKNADADDPEESDYLMIRNLCDHWEKLNARGGVIRIHGKVAAFSIGSLEGDTAFIHFEKAEAAFDGLYAAINKLVLDHEFADARYVNREEDLGIPGLRQAKQSYYPVAMVRKYKMDIL